MDKIQKLIERRALDLMGLKNVIAVGKGKKIIAGKVLNIDCISVTVRKKENLMYLSKSQIVPAKIKGIPTDVVESQDIVALGYTKKERPAHGGCSIGHFDITAGTFGCIVYDVDNTKLMLSNNHVLANSNDGKRLDAILQPGPTDGGFMTDTIGRLDAFVPIRWEDDGGNGDCSVVRLLAGILNGLARGLRRHSRLYRMTQATENLVDAAVATLGKEKDAVRDIHEIGVISGMGEPEIDMAVQKTGRTTGQTKGKVIQTNVTVRVGYGGSRAALFVDQIMFSHMSEPGDSGSVIMNEDHKAIALLFAGSGTTTIGCKMQHVFDALDLKQF